MRLKKIKKGQFILEYTGELFLLKGKHDKTKTSASSSKKSKSERKKIGFRLTAEDVVYRETAECHKDFHEYEPLIRDERYSAGFSVLDARACINSSKIGNAARFIAHSCTPNATLIEAHSRRFESDPLIPRIAIYAIKAISFGEGITIRYWSQDQMKKHTDTPCRCRPDCPNFMQI